MKINKYALVVMTAVLTLGALSFPNWITGKSSKVSWERVNPPGSRFTISFPTPPAFAEKKLPSVKAGPSLSYRELTSEARGSNYSVSYLDFPRKWKLIGTHNLLRKSLDLLVKHEGNGRTLLTHKLVSHRGYPALDYVTQEGGREIHGRLVVVGNTLFKINVNHQLGKDAAQDSFVASFDPFSHNR